MKNRIRMLFIKFFSVKGVFAILNTILFTMNPEKDFIFWAFLSSWLVFIGGREAIKILELLKGVNDESDQDDRGGQA